MNTISLSFTMAQVKEIMAASPTFEQVVLDKMFSGGRKTSPYEKPILKDNSGTVLDVPLGLRKALAVTARSNKIQAIKDIRSAFVDLNTPKDSWGYAPSVVGLKAAKDFVEELLLIDESARKGIL